MREVYASSEKHKPLVLVQEMDVTKGGAPLAELQDECAVDVREFVFGAAGAPHTITEWYRITEYQLVSLVRVVKGMLLTCPTYAGSLALELFIPKEPSRLQLAFAAPSPMRCPAGARLHSSRRLALSAKAAFLAHPRCALTVTVMILLSSGLAG